jgi:D-citramalate synthase
MVNSECLFSVEKLTIAQLLLEELNVDRIEIASACKANFKGKGIMAWASTKGYENRIEFNFVDGGLSIEWMKKAGLKFKIY